MDLIATFPSSHAALLAEQALKGAGLGVELIPVPRQIHSDCGFCLLAGEEAEPTLRACGARELWRVTVHPHASRKVKSYERCP